jgi:hypothetical protein
LRHKKQTEETARAWDTGVSKDVNTVPLGKSCSNQAQMQEHNQL